MAEYIEREATIAKITEIINQSGKYTDYECGADDACYIVNHIPSADVRPVVLCKDCVHSDKWYKDRLICYLWNEHDGNSVFEDGFCNYGKRKKEES